MPYWDEWETPLLLQHASQGTLTLGELWAIHAGSHRLFLPRVLDLILVKLTNYNRQIEMSFDLGVSISAAWLLYRLLRQSVRSRRLALVLVLPLSLLYFSLGQFADWFAPFQLSFTAAVFGLVLALWAVSGDAHAGAKPLAWWRFGLALLGALIATLSAFQGLMVWIAVVPTLAWHARRHRPTTRKLILWIGAGIEVWLVYLAGFVRYTYPMTLHDVYTYTLIYLGAPVGYPDMARSEVLGLLAVALLPASVALYWAIGGRLQRILPWLDAALFVALCTVATLGGRIAGGPLSAFSSRYQIFSAIWWIALVVIAGLLVEELWQRTSHPHHVQLTQMTKLPSWRSSLASLRCRRAASLWIVVGVQVGAVIAICCSLVPANLAGTQDALVWQDVQRINQPYILHYETAPGACLTVYHPWPTMIRPQLDYLKQHHLAVFSAPPPTNGDESRAPLAVSIPPCTKPCRFTDNGGRKLSPQDDCLVVDDSQGMPHSTLPRPSTPSTTPPARMRGRS